MKDLLKKIIYIPVWLDQKSSDTSAQGNLAGKFTFQYGQIRNQVFTMR